MKAITKFLTVASLAVLGITLSLPSKADVVVFHQTGLLTVPGSTSTSYPTFTLGAGIYKVDVHSVLPLPFFSFLEFDVYNNATSSLLASAIEGSANPTFVLAAPTQIAAFVSGAPGFLLSAGTPPHTFDLFKSSFSATITLVPEPAVWLLMAGGIFLLGWLRVRKSEEIS